MEITSGPQQGVGWLACSVRKPFALVRVLLEEFFGPLELQEYGTRWYECAARVGIHSLVAWKPRKVEEGERLQEVCITIKQSDCDALGWERSAELARRIQAWDPHWTRADVRFDDPARIVEPAEVKRAFLEGQKVTHFRAWDWRESHSKGSTFYMGTRQSEAMIRVYDADVVHGEGHGVRWELEAHDTRAAYVVEHVILGLGGSAEAPQDRFWGLMQALVDFRDRAGVANGDRAPQLPWWQQLIASAKRVQLAAEKRVDSLARRLVWFERQVQPTLALLVRAHADDPNWIWGQVWAGLGRIRETTWSLVDPPPGLAPVGG